MFTGLALLIAPMAACSGDSPTEPFDVDPAAAVVSDAVRDLEVSDVTDSTVTLSWTQVDDGTGKPADYRLKYAAPPIDWSEAEIGCDRTLRGDAIGAEMSCTVEGLTAGTAYDFQMMSYRIRRGRWEGAVYSNVASATTTEPGAADAGSVQDLAIVAASDSTLTLSWTQVDDGTGAPAWYRVKYAEPNIDWSTATVGCDATLKGDRIGAEMSCTVVGLADGTEYDVLMMSYRMVDGAWEGAVYSNVARGSTDAASVVVPTSNDDGIWISRSKLMSLPTSGSAWNNLLSEANGSCGSVDLANQDQNNNVCVMAKALVAARTGDAVRRLEVISSLTQVVTAPTYSGRALALGRELGAYVIAADLIDLKSVDPVLDAAFRTAIRGLLTTATISGPSSLVDCHERRPNNWGTHCGGSRAAVAAYLGDEAELARVAQVFKGWLGDRSSYAGFSYGDLAWQCDPNRPVGINPAGCTRNGYNIDGVIADDQRRAGGFTWPAPRENYVWEALQGALAQAVILERAGYPAFQWEGRALLRAVEWLHDENGYPAEGDDGWQPHVVNHFYGTNFPAPTPARAGKNVGWTDWTHGG